MIFVTVGTHEQQFNRLVKKMDTLVAKKIIKEEVFIQTGFSSYEPKRCKWSRWLSFSDMKKKMAEARIVVTHGGPSSFIMPLQMGKIPIVVPRSHEYDEHVIDKKCRAKECKAMAVIEIDPEKCKGCTKCARTCPVGAIEGTVKNPNKIDPSKCIKCEACLNACPFKAISKE